MDLERRAKCYLEYILFCIFNIVARNVTAENSKGETMKKTLSKAGYAIQCVAGELCKCDVGDKIPTVTELLSREYTKGPICAQRSKSYCT